MPKYTLGISDMSFYGFHGFYAEERKVGGWYNVSVKLQLNISEQSNFKSLDNTVNYEEIHSIVGDIMGRPQELIESIAKDIYDKIKSSFSEIELLEVQLVKLNPPMNNVGQTSFEVSDF